ncbi:MAG TPA: response regulator transcription factor [Pseudobacteroides sp.]|nr:response regulator transcription factor [Pseudobacteroides sp.]
MSKGMVFAVEDEENIQQLIKYNLEAHGYKVKNFDTGEKLIEQCKIAVPDLFLLDVMLPGIDGFEVCRWLKQDANTKTIPVIMLTAKSDEFDKVLGLELGADDYITKPFSVRELVARVKAVFRRMSLANQSNTDVLSFGNIKIDCSRREVVKDDKIVDMAFKEFELLKLLVMNKGKVLSRDMLLEKIWGYDYYGETRTVDVHIRYLRQKLEDDDSNPVFIETVRGIGYRIKDKGANQ